MHFRNILTISFFGYGFAINYIGYDGKNYGSLDEYDLFGGWGKNLNPYITFVINYRWITFSLLLNRG